METPFEGYGEKREGGKEMRLRVTDKGGKTGDGGKDEGEGRRGKGHF